MFKLLKKDSFLLGIVLGVLMPAICFGILYFLNVTFPNKETGKEIFRLTTVFIVSLIPNAIALRIYLVNLKADRTGKGILFVTFIFAIIFMILYYKG
ncbi:MAG TPA: hypothetical protein PKI01_11945 [Bacteroidales bacterium]|nr:hypothetical protein [Bacteroidales bacterium]